MSKVSVFDQKWLDLVFEGRNKEYGAYQLRQQDPRTTLTALFSGIVLLGLLVSIPVIANLFKEEIVETPVQDPGGLKIVDADEIFLLPKEEPEPVIQNEPAAPAPRPSEPTTRHTTLVATSEPVAADPPTTTQLIETTPSNSTSEGTGQGIVLGPTSPDGTDGSTGTSTTGTGTGNELINYALLDEAPDFPGGIKNFLKKVGNEFNTPDIGREGTLKVLVSFVVEKDGSMTAIKVTRDPGNGLGDEAIRALKSIKTKWKPGIKNGKPVRTAYTLPIVVNVK